MTEPFNLKTSKLDGQPDPKNKIVPVYVEIESLDDLDLGNELLSSYNRASRLFTMIEHDDEILPGQKAQVLSAIRHIQEQILKNQERLHNVNQIKLIETTLIDVLKGFPDVKAAFLAAYEEAGKNLA